MSVSQDLWKVLNSIRCRINVADFKNYVMPFMFYVAANQKVELLMKEELANEMISGGVDKDGNELPPRQIKYAEAWDLKDEDGEYVYKEELREIQKESLGYVIEPYNSCVAIVPAVLDHGEYFIDRFQEAIEAFDNNCADTFRGSLRMVNFDTDALGSDPDFIEDLMFNRLFKPVFNVVLKAMSDPDKDALGQLYMEIMSHFAANAGKGGGEFFTPICMSKLVAKLATYGKKNAQKIYDPTCGSGSLLIKVKDEIYNHIDENGRHGHIGKIYGQEIELITSKQAKMNMSMYDIKVDDFDIKCCDTLGRTDSAGDNLFDITVANPPYSVSWDNSNRELEDRFAGYGAVAPAKTADLAFVQHIVNHMADGGRAAILLPHGVLFRGNAEKKIREVLIENHNIIDAIVGLPSDCFYGASIAVACIVLRKDRNGDSNDICFIDASRDFVRVGNKNQITDEHIEKIMKAYGDRKDIDNYCSIVSLDKIRENDYNLNIPLYVEAPKDTTEHNLGELFKEYKNLEDKAEELKKSINKQLASFGIEERFLGIA